MIKNSIAYLTKVCPPLDVTALKRLSHTLWNYNFIFIFSLSSPELFKESLQTTDEWHLM